MILKRKVDHLMIALVFLIAACGSIIHGTRQEISFNTEPAGAGITVTDPEGEVEQCDTPCVLNLKRKKAYAVLIEKEGHAAARFVLERKSSGWVWGNFVFGGLIGIIVDFSNGAAYRLEPEFIQTTLSAQSSGSVSGDEVRLVVLDVEELPGDQRSRVTSNDQHAISLWVESDRQ